MVQLTIASTIEPDWSTTTISRAGVVRLGRSAGSRAGRRRAARPRGSSWSGSSRWCGRGRGCGRPAWAAPTGRSRRRWSARTWVRSTSATSSTNRRISALALARATPDRLSLSRSSCSISDMLGVSCAASAGVGQHLAQVHPLDQVAFAGRGRATPGRRPSRAAPRAGPPPARPGCAARRRQPRPARTSRRRPASRASWLALTLPEPVAKTLSSSFDTSAARRTSAAAARPSSRRGPSARRTRRPGRGSAAPGCRPTPPGRAAPRAGRGPRRRPRSRTPGRAAPRGRTAGPAAASRAPGGGSPGVATFAAPRCGSAVSRRSPWRWPALAPAAVACSLGVAVTGRALGSLGPLICAATFRRARAARRPRRRPPRRP